MPIDAFEAHGDRRVIDFIRQMEGRGVDMIPLAVLRDLVDGRGAFSACPADEAAVRVVRMARTQKLESYR